MYNYIQVPPTLHLYSQVRALTQELKKITGNCVNSFCDDSKKLVIQEWLLYTLDIYEDPLIPRKLSLVQEK